MKKVIVLVLLVLLGCSGPKDAGEDRFIRISSQYFSGLPVIVVCDRETMSEYVLVPDVAFRPLGTSCKDVQ